MLFFLTAANGRPYWWNSAVPSLLISLWLIGLRSPRTIVQRAFSKQNRSIAWCLLGLTIWSGIAALAAADLIAGWTFALRCAIPVAIYFALVGMPLKGSDVRLCLLSIMAGASVPLFSGLYAFYREVGVPDLRELLYVRYDLDRMWNYMDVTFGNMGNVGMYAGLVAPCIFVAISARIFERTATTFSRLWLGMVILNVIISGSRTYWAVTLAMGAFLFASLQRGLAVLAVVVAIASAGAYVSSPDNIDQSLWTERLLPSMGSAGRDVSIEERIDSTKIGWETFVDHPITGVGPGMSDFYNVYSVPHQSLVMVASETGLFGAIAFFFLNLVVLFRCAKHAIRSRRSYVDRQRLIWIAGPASWLIGGLLAGICFNMDLALLWVGICHAMLGLYGFHQCSEDNSDQNVGVHYSEIRNRRIEPSRLTRRTTA